MGGEGYKMKCQLVHLSENQGFHGMPHCKRLSCRQDQYLQSC